MGNQQWIHGREQGLLLFIIAKQKEEVNKSSKSLSNNY